MLYVICFIIFILFDDKESSYDQFLEKANVYIYIAINSAFKNQNRFHFLEF